MWVILLGFTHLPDRASAAVVTVITVAIALNVALYALVGYAIGILFARINSEFTSRRSS
jgi:hypothetical protein